MAKKQSKPRLTKRDYAILKDAAQFGMVVPEILHAQRFAGKKLAAVISTLRRLYGRPPNYLYLRPEKLDTNRVYYQLTNRGCNLIGHSRDASRPFGRHAVASRYATLWFICADQPNGRNRFDPRAFPTQFPNVRGRLPKQNFYIEQSEVSMKLGYFITDMRTDMRRLVRNSCCLMRKFIDNGWFNDYLVTHRFAFNVLTFNAAKAEEIQRKLNQEFAEQLARPLQAIGVPDGQHAFAAQVVTVPGLDTLIPQPR